MGNNIRVYPLFTRAEPALFARGAASGPSNQNHPSRLAWVFTHTGSTVVLFTRSITKLVRQS
jgi:hypothetical protein